MSHVLVTVFLVSIFRETGIKMVRMFIPMLAVISVILYIDEAQGNIPSPHVIVSNRQFDQQREIDMDRLSERVGAAISNRQERFGNQSLPRLPSGIQEDSRLDVAYLLRDAVDTHLPGCHKVRGVCWALGGRNLLA